MTQPEAVQGGTRDQELPFQREGFGPGTHVSVVMPNGLATVRLLLGAMAGGRCVNPVNLLSSPEQMRYVLEHSDSRVAFASPEWAPRLREIAGGIGRELRVIEVDPDAAELPGESAADSAVPLPAVEPGESQINGGIILGIGFALYEERVMDRESGVVLNPNFETYKLPALADMPEIDVILLDMPERGVIGIGEPVTIPTAAAIANAVANALGVRANSLPITPAKVLAAHGQSWRSRLMKPFLYATATSPARARELVVEEGRYLAGGIDLLGELKENLAEAKILVNVKALPGLDKIEPGDPTWSIGANVTVSQLEEHGRLREVDGSGSTCQS